MRQAPSSTSILVISAALLTCLYTIPLNENHKTFTAAHHRLKCKPPCSGYSRKASALVSGKYRLATGNHKRARSNSQLLRDRQSWARVRVRCTPNHHLAELYEYVCTYVCTYIYAILPSGPAP